jgi:hypothetical protein
VSYTGSDHQPENHLLIYVDDVAMFDLDFIQMPYLSLGLDMERV